jgi:hypothetical protein
MGKGEGRSYTAAIEVPEDLASQVPSQPFDHPAAPRGGGVGQGAAIVGDLAVYLAADEADFHDDAPAAALETVAE